MVPIKKCVCPSSKCPNPTISKRLKCIMNKCKFSKEQLEFCKKGILPAFDVSSVKKSGYKGDRPAFRSDQLFEVPMPPTMGNVKKEKSVHVFHSFRDRFET